MDRFKLATNKIKLALQAALIVSSLLLPTLQSSRLSAASGTWVDGAMPSITLGDATSGAQLAKECFPGAITYYSYTKPDMSYSSIARDVTTDACITTNSLGKYGNTAFTPSSTGTAPYDYNMVTPGNGLAYRVTASGRTTSVIPVPNKGTFIYPESDPINTGGRYLHFYDSFLQEGSFGQYNVSTSVQELAYKVNYTASSRLKDASGQPLSMVQNHYAFSANGDWMLVEIGYTGIVRINTRTRESHLIAANYQTAFTASSSYRQMAISNDGKAALIASGTSLTAYDLSACSNTSFIRGSSTNLATGCRQRALDSTVNTAAPGLNGVYEPRFLDDSRVRIVASQRVQLPGGSTYVNSWRYATITVAGYQAPPTTYLALGDSFSSGEGAPSQNLASYPNGYVTGTDTGNPRNRCHLSPESYPYVAARSAGFDEFHSVACSGDTYGIRYLAHAQYPESATRSNHWLPGTVPQVEYLSMGSVDTVTLTMFGNDIGFGDKIKRCILATDSCFHFKEDRQSIAAEISNQFDNMVSMYQSVKSGSDNRKVYVLGYPKLMATDPLKSCGSNTSFNMEEREFAAGLVTYLNATIKAATQKAGVQYIDVENAFAGHELCSDASGSDIAVNGLTAGNSVAIGPFDDLYPIGSESFHPNQLGHKLMAQALLAQSQNFSLEMPTPNLQSTFPWTSSSAYNSLIGTAPSGGNNAAKRLLYESSTASDIIYKGVTLNIDNPVTEALKPSSVFEVWANSTPTLMGTINSNQSGQLSGQVTIPTSLEPGFHTIHVYGPDVGGHAVDIYKTVYVAASENDFDGDGAPNDQEKCLVVDPANVDSDHDNIDDACDGQIVDITPKDDLAPTVTGVPDRAPNDHGWYNNDVTVTWSAEDPAPSSGTPSTPDQTTATQEGTHSYASSLSCDPANNCATGNIELSIDKTLPVLQYTLTSEANNNSWHKTGLVITFTCDDPLANQLDPTSTSGIATCPDPITVDEDGQRSITATAIDNAGNSATTTIPIAIDSTAPVISFSTDRTPNANGWFNGPVQVTFDCSDTTSGIDACTAPVIVSAEGGTIVTGTALDVAGNQQSVNVFILIDSDLPQISYTASTVPNEFGWNNTDVTLSFTCTDSTSGVSVCSNPVTLSGEGRGLSATAQAADRAGNRSSILASPIHIDRTAPKVLSMSFSATAKATNESASLTAEFSDALSGIQRAEYYLGDIDPGEGNGATVQMVTGTTGKVIFGADYPAGVYKVSVRSRDFAGNWSEASSDYLVVYDTSQIRVTGKRILTPSLANGDVLPGLLSSSKHRDNVATFGFSISYDKRGDLTRNSDFQFSYDPAYDNCADNTSHNHRRLPPCPTFDLDATQIDWLVASDNGAHTVSFQGLARTEVNGVRAMVKFRAIATDGVRHGAKSQDHLELLIFANGADTFKDNPLYRVSEDVERGNIRIALPEKIRY